MTAGPGQKASCTSSPKQPAQDIFVYTSGAPGAFGIVEFQNVKFFLLAYICLFPFLNRTLHSRIRRTIHVC